MKLQMEREQVLMSEKNTRLEIEISNLREELQYTKDFYEERIQ